MKERSKERIAALLMEELLEQLAERENIKRMLADMTPLPVDELIEGLLDEFEKVVERRHREVIDTAIAKRDKRRQQKEKAHPPSEQPTQHPSSTEVAETSHAPLSKTEINVEPFRIDVNPIEVKAASYPEPPPAKAKAPEPPPARHVEPPREHKKPARSLAEQAEELIKKLQVTDKKKEEVRPAPASLTKPLDIPDEPDIEEEEPIVQATQLDAAAQKRRRVPYSFSDDDLVYLHAVTRIPEGESASTTPFMLEEKGIDARSFAFAVDYGGVRFYLSKILTGVMNVSKTGVLLLGKQESLQLQGAHQSILNDLRNHGPLLPFEFGTVARGKDEFQGKIDDALDRLQESLDETFATTRWALSVSALDGRIAGLVMKDETATRMGRVRDRESFMQGEQPKKYDIKMLERILNKEKKLAESIHEELDQLAQESEIESMVGLGSGSSEDWKLIMKATYAVKPQYLQNFNRKVTDLQYHHLMYELMLALSGNCEYFSLKGKGKH